MFINFYNVSTTFALFTSCCLVLSSSVFSTQEACPPPNLAGQKMIYATSKQQKASANSKKLQKIAKSFSKQQKASANSPTSKNKYVTKSSRPHHCPVEVEVYLFKQNTSFFLLNSKAVQMPSTYRSLCNSNQREDTCSLRYYRSGTPFDYLRLLTSCQKQQFLSEFD